MRIALLGGSFNPPHLVHQMACLYLLQAEGFERVWMLPCARHAFSKDLVPFEHRLAMCSLAVRIFGGRVVVSEVESALAGPDGNRTIDTVDHLKAHHPECDFTFVIGSDILGETAGWKDFCRLRQEIPFFVLRRSGYEVTDSSWQHSAVEFPAISSTGIRKRLEQGEDLRGFAPQPVLSYIQEHGLYLIPG